MQDLIKGGQLLSAGDLALIGNLIDAATADNTRRAYASDLSYFWAWAHLVAGQAHNYPVPAALVVRFILDHTGKMDAGLDAALVAAGIKRRLGPHGIATVRRRIAALSVAHKFQGIGKEHNPCAAEPVRLLLSKAHHVAVKAGWRPAKKKAVTLDLLHPMLNTCRPDKLIDVRDRALLFFAWSSGGRRRSEVAEACTENLTQVADGFIYHLGHSKTDQKGHGLDVPLLGRAAEALNAWLSAADIEAGPIFRPVDKGGRVREGSIQPITVARIVQHRALLAGLDPKLFGGHSLRSGFITEAGMQGKPLGDIMAMSGHKTVAVVNGYYQAGNVLNNTAAKLAG